ncbi:MAG: methyltransferase domain-containing protein [Caldilineaceae bacterium]
MDTKKLVQQQFGATAASYATSKVHAQGASLARLVELVQPQADWQMLDIATAAGHTAFIFAPHVAHVIASDITPEMLTVAEEQAAKKGITNATTQLADAEELPFTDATFDLVTCRIAPHHFPHIDRFLAESARVLKAGGTLAVVDNITPEDHQAADYIDAIERLRDPSHVHCLSLAEWRTGFTQAGVTLLHEEVADKALEFIDWARRMKISNEVESQLRQLFLAAPPAVVEFLGPQVVGDDIHFVLKEAILIGQKPPQSV